MVNKIKFTTPVSMKCTQKQYNEDLKESLENMGYKHYNTYDTGYAVTYWGQDTGKISYTKFYDEPILRELTTFIDHYNPELFLALAAMTSGKPFNIGEYGYYDSKLFKINCFGYNQSYRDGITIINKECICWGKATKEELIDHFSKGKDNFVLPDKWCIKDCEEVTNYAADKWRCGTKVDDRYYCESNEHDSRFMHYNYLYGFKSKIEIPNDYTEITIEQFRKYVLNKKEDKVEEDNRFPFTLTEKDAKRIINIACNDWKSQLGDKWGKRLLIAGELKISESFYKTMRNACTDEQHKLFDEIFGNDIDDKNAFVKKFSSSYLGDVSRELFGDDIVLQIGDYAPQTIGRRDLEGRSLFINEYYEVILHNKVSGTIIEIKKKGDN